MPKFFSPGLLIVALLSTSLISTLAWAGTNYYVSKTGSDSPLNGTISNPWLTIQYAITHDSVIDGDTINVASGTYTEALNVSKSLSLRGAGSSATIIAAPGDLFSNTSYRYQNSPSLFNQRVALVHIAPGESVAIEGFTIDGQNSAPAPVTIAFTGIMVEQASATIRGNTVKNFLPSDTSGTVSASLSGRGIEVLGGAFASLIDSNVVQTCQRHHILVTSSDDLSSTPGAFPNAIVSRNVITGVGQSKLGQKGIWFNWGAYGRIIGNTVTNLDYTNSYIESDRGSGIVIKHGEYRTGGASRVLISGNTVTASSFTNNKGIFAEGKGDTISDNIVTGFRFGIQVDDQDSAFVVRNTITGGQIGVVVSTTTITPVAPYVITVGGSPANKNTITGQDTSSIGAAIALSFRDASADGTFMSTVPVDARYNDFGVYTESAIRSRIWDRADTTLISGNPVDTVNYYPFYVDKIRASVKVYLQGPYVAAADSMSNALRTGGHLASHFGGTIPTLAVDSINLEIRNAASAAASTIRKFAPAWLMTDGTIRNFSDATKSYVEFDTTISGNYYIVVRHRNHIAIMDSLPLQLDGSVAPVAYDFTTSQSKAYGSNPMKPVGTKYAMYAGDATSNGQVQTNDINAGIRPKLGQAGYLSGDANLNGQVQTNDINTFARPNLGKGTQVP